MVEVSAGLLMYYIDSGKIKVFLAHPGGPYWKNKDHYGIPKGGVEIDGKGDNEKLLETTLREFKEETGMEMNTKKENLIDIGSVRRKSGKIVHVWAFQGTGKEKFVKSNEFEMEWAKNIFAKTKAVHDKDNKPMEYKNPEELGKAVQSWLISFLKEGPVIAFVLEGPHAIEIARKLLGHTEPRQAIPGTIRGDFISVESYAVADKKKRVIRNLVHASDNRETTEKEIALWFNKEELHSYKKELERHF